jgi:hypothetical protein
MIDRRNYYATLTLVEEGYLSYNQLVFVDSNFIKSDQLNTRLTIVENEERTFGGQYNFQVFNAHALKAVKRVSGDYMLGENSSSEWRSDREGNV